ncbi:MAG: DUF2709 domain-containing protein [Chlamydiae bacterium]|nr:DUF2709 domain-containing protein [Chlamydiota bacterium]
MGSIDIPEDVKKELLKFLQENKKNDLVEAYLFFVEKKFNIRPVLFPREKTIYQSVEELIKHLEEKGQLWRETEIRIQFGQESVNEETKKIYICPFTGKVFGDNTHLNPQDAIYDWVSKCPENTERVGGLKVKRFFVSEDPEIIKKYIGKGIKPVTKTVYSSLITGKLFNSKKAVIDDFKKSHVKRLSLFEVQNQNRYQIENHLLEFIQKHLTEDKISEFVESISDYEEFKEYVENWTE